MCAQITNHTLYPPTHPLHSLAFPSPLPCRGDLLLIRNVEEVTEHFTILVKDDGGNFKLALQGDDFPMEGWREVGHF